MGQVSTKFLNGKCHICVKPLKLKLKICPSIITLLVYFRSIVVAYTGNMVQILLDLTVTNDNQTSPKKKNTKQNKQKKKHLNSINSKSSVDVVLIFGGTYLNF